MSGSERREAEMDTEYLVPGCPDGEEEATVLEYLSGDVDAGGRRRFEAHLESCEACANELKQWMVVRRAIAVSSVPAAELDFSTMDEREASLALAELEARQQDRLGGRREPGWRDRWRGLLAGVLPGRAHGPVYKLGWALSATLVVVVAGRLMVPDPGAPGGPASDSARGAGVSEVGLTRGVDLAGDSRTRAVESAAAEAESAVARRAGAPAAPQAGSVATAAAAGDADAQNALGTAYRRGDGVPRDLVLAHMWFSIASANGSDAARLTLGELENEMTPAQIAEAERRAQVCRGSGYQDCGL